MPNARQTAAANLAEIASELEAAARHCRTAAAHFTNDEVPRAGAHALAARGHLHAATRLLDELALAHARRSTP